VVVPDVDPGKVGVTGGQVGLNAITVKSSSYAEASTYIGSVLVVSKTVILQRSKLFSVPIRSVDRSTAGSILVATRKLSVREHRNGEEELTCNLQHGGRSQCLDVRLVHRMR
jgi:hypothetical protein